MQNNTVLPDICCNRSRSRVSERWEVQINVPSIHAFAFAFAQVSPTSLVEGIQAWTQYFREEGVNIGLDMGLCLSEHHSGMSCIW